MMTTTLALSDGWEIGIFIVGIFLVLAQMITGAILGFLLQREKQRSERLVRLEQNLEQRAEQLIESKLSGVATEIEGVVTIFNDRINNILDRMSRGDQEFKDLDARDRELETRFNLRFDKLKDYLHATFATKEDVAATHRRIDTIKSSTGGTHGL